MEDLPGYGTSGIELSERHYLFMGSHLKDTVR
jgi:hypothetical protein